MNKRSRPNSRSSRRTLGQQTVRYHRGAHCHACGERHGRGRYTPSRTPRRISISATAASLSRSRIASSGCCPCTISCRAYRRHLGCGAGRRPISASTPTRCSARPGLTLMQSPAFAPRGRPRMSVAPDSSAREHRAADSRNAAVPRSQREESMSEGFTIANFRMSRRACSQASSQSASARRRWGWPTSI
jgi:hypothetical protein